MNTQPLSPESEQRVKILFPESLHEFVCALLVEECGNELPGLKDADPAAIDRCRFAVLKLSEGDLAKLDMALELARTDWRDLLTAAGFGESLTAHESWLPEKTADCALNVESRKAPPTDLCSKIAESIETLIRIGFRLNLDGSASEIARNIQSEYFDRLPSGEISDAVVLETLIARGGVGNGWSFDTEEMEVSDLICYARQLAGLAGETLQEVAFVEDVSRPVHLEMTIGDFHETLVWPWERDEPGCVFVGPLLNALTALPPMQRAKRVFGYVDHGQVFSAFCLGMKGALNLRERIGRHVYIARSEVRKEDRPTPVGEILATTPEPQPRPPLAGLRSSILLTELSLYLLPLYPETENVVDHVQLHLWEGGSEVTVEPASPYPAELGFGNPQILTGIRLTGPIDSTTIELCLRIPSLHRLPILACCESRFRSIQQALGAPVPFMATVQLEDCDFATFAAYPERYFLEGEWSRTLFLGNLRNFTDFVYFNLPNGRYVIPCFRWCCSEQIPPGVPVRQTLEEHAPSWEIVRNRIYIFEITRANCLARSTIGFANLNEALVHLRRRGVQGRYMLAECVDGVDMF